MKNSLSVRELLTQTIDIFREAGVENARGEAEIIFSEKLNIPRMELYLKAERPVSGSEQLRISDSIQRRGTLHEPLQYILGQAYFRELVLNVGPGVLVPRPETELLAGYVVEHAPPDSLVCDIGTGSGAIALSVAYERPDCQVTGVEVCEEAIRYARKNLKKHQLPNAKIIKSDLFSRLRGKRFDVITANLPYVTEEEFAMLNPEVRDFEPAKALLGGKDGLDIVRRLIAQAPDHLSGNGFMIMELGIGHGRQVCDMCLATRYFSEAEIISDQCGRDRFVVTR